MKLPKSIHRLAAIAAVLPALSLMGADDAAKPQITVVQGISTPTGKPRNLTFPDVGLMQSVSVKPGDVVKNGQELASEDTDLEATKLVELKKKALSTAEIDAAKADSDSKKITRDNLTEAFKTQSCTPQELQEAELAYTKAKIAIVYAQEQHDIAQIEVDSEQKKLDKMKLISPMDGIVQKVSIQPGEVVDPNKPDGVLTIVNNTPLWVDMHVQSALAAKLKVGDKLQAAYSNDPEVWLDGSIIYLDPVVDAASDTETVRLELPNKEGKPSGLQLNVRVPFVNDKAGQTALGR